MCFRRIIGNICVIFSQTLICLGNVPCSTEIPDSIHYSSSIGQIPPRAEADSINLDTRLESNENININELQELVVEGTDRWIENDKVVFIPGKRAKNLGKDISTMVDLLNTGLLKVDNGIIKTQGGETVSIFINGVPADKLDQATFWAKNTIKVEFIPVPTDPKFMGERNVLNLIMKEYKSGGLVKLNVWQAFPEDGYYSASSKTAWDKYTLNIGFWGSYKHDNISCQSSEEQYQNCYFNGNQIPLITFNETTQNIEHSGHINVAANLRYLSDKMRLTHGIAYNWDNSPINSHSGKASYSPLIFSGSEINSSTSKKLNSFSVLGNYAFLLSSRWTFFSNWAFSYSHNKSTSFYHLVGSEFVKNDAKEKNWGISGGFNLNYKIRDNLNVGVGINDTFKDFNILYAGTCDSRQKFKTNDLKGNVYCQFIIPGKSTVYVKPEISVFSRYFGSYNQNDIIPGFTANWIWQINAKSSLNSWISFYQTPPSSNSLNNLLLKQTELKWIEGNDKLKGSQQYSVNSSYYILPVTWFNFNCLIGYEHLKNQPFITYNSGGKNYNGVISTYSNSNDFGYWHLSPTISTSIINGKLKISLKGTYYGFHGTDFKIKNYFSGIGNMSFYWGNWSLAAKYCSPQSFIWFGGIQRIKSSATYELSCSYGNGSLFAEVTLRNIFNKYYQTKTYYSSEYYNSVNIDNQIGRSVFISLVYTFGYGKKTDSSIDISKGEAESSAILGF